MERKKVPEELAAEAMNIIRDCEEGSGAELWERVENLQNRFDQLSDDCYEARELCEEATAAMQVSCRPPLSLSPSPSLSPSLSLYLSLSLSLPPSPQAYQGKEKVFQSWLTEAGQRLEERSSSKKPIGIIHSETEDFSVSKGLKSRHV